MSVINALAKKYIRNDKTKTLILCVTIILVTVLISGVFSATLSNRQSQTYMMSYMPQLIISSDDATLSKRISEDKKVDKLVTVSPMQSIVIGEDEGRMLFVSNEKYFDSIAGDFPQDESEVLLEQNAAKRLHKDIGDTLKLVTDDGESRTFTISAIGHRAITGDYPYVYMSTAYQQAHQNEVLATNMTIYLKDNDSITVEETQTLAGEWAEKYGIDLTNISVYLDYFTLSSREITGKEIIQYLMLGFVILFAAALVLYSVYFISINTNIKEYGKLRAIGMTRLQIKKIIRKEALYLAIPSSLSGTLMGLTVSYFLNPQGFHWLNFLVVGLVSFLFGNLISLFSALKPAKYASEVSPIEASKHSGFDQIGYASHEKSRQVTPFYLAVLTIRRNLKKTRFTVLSLALCGTLFIVILGIFSSISTEHMARNTHFVDGEYKFQFTGDEDVLDGLDTQSKNYSVAALQAYENSLNFNLTSEIENLEGVEQVTSRKATTVRFSFHDKQASDQTLVKAYKPSDKERLQESLIAGSLDNNVKNAVVVNVAEHLFEDVYKITPEVGDVIQMSFRLSNGDIVTEDFTVIALADKSDGFIGIFRIPEEEMDRICDYNTIYELVIKAKDNVLDSSTAKRKLEKQLIETTGNSGTFSYQSMAAYIKDMEQQYSQTFSIIMVFLLFLLMFALLNLINLTITNYMDRKQQIDIMLSIGMTNKQLSFSRIMENEIMIGLSTILSIFLGVGGGIFAVNILSDSGMFEGYVFPLIPLIGFIFLMMVFGIVIEVVLGFITRRESRR